jgi:hypothetical protein
LDDIFNTTTDSLSIKWWCPTTPSPSAAFTYQGVPPCALLLSVRRNVQRAHANA